MSSRAGAWEPEQMACERVICAGYEAFCYTIDNICAMSRSIQPLKQACAGCFVPGTQIAGLN